METTAQLRHESGGQQLTLRTDAATSYRALGIPMTLGFGFLLAAGLSAFERHYRGGIIAADIAQHYECIEGAYGTSSGITPFMASERFGLSLVDLDYSRIDKLPLLANDPVALATISCCKDDATRPENCGVCVKCVRTKGNFLAITGTIPDIFLTPGLAPHDFDAIDLRLPVYREAWRRMLAQSKQNGTDALLAPIAARVENHFHPSALRWAIYRLKVKWRARQARR